MCENKAKQFPHCDQILLRAGLNEFGLTKHFTKGTKIDFTKYCQSVSRNYFEMYLDSLQNGKTDNFTQKKKKNK